MCVPKNVIMKQNLMFLLHRGLLMYKIYSISKYLIVVLCKHILKYFGNCIGVLKYIQLKTNTLLLLIYLYIFFYFKKTFCIFQDDYKCF